MKVKRVAIHKIRIISVETGEAEFSARDNAYTKDLVEQAVGRLTKKLIARIEGRLKFGYRLNFS